MEFEDQEEQEEEMGMQATSYDSLGNSSRVKMGTNQLANEASPSLLPGHQQTQQPRKPRYRECLKNHAVGIGGHAVDGCCEFMAAGSEGTLDALKCAACNCHRNFHRKETDPFSGNSGRPTAFGNELYFPNPHQVPQFTPYYRTPSGYLHVAAAVPPQQRPLALPSTSGGTHSREDQEDVSNPGFVGSSTRKRFRTKFTQEQKEKMLALAEKLGWRIQKHDDAVVQQFCNETGVKRHVLKVWMHNNKHTLGI
ncbi:ZF-HD_dimer domain-containing protein [Cephalotus follicularis]|uniref:ZF-HD_dimer domain-containing protein n=1 Tax=Cephalotus follicularis TaxID=3775 RepID=A0A1Q3BIS9_CEPFO|nr:ZF-HD_dimer domain-containing protein [Cephalotus follicularis]